MIGYVTLGTNSLEKAAVFYDALLSELGAGRFLENEQFVAWSKGPDQLGLSVTHPFDGKPATVGNGGMVALHAESPGQVDRIHSRALELGGTDEGATGFREEMPGFYAGYFRDLDGNKLNVFCIVPEKAVA